MNEKAKCAAYKFFVAFQQKENLKKTGYELAEKSADHVDKSSTDCFCYIPEGDRLPCFLVLKDKKENFFFLSFSEKTKGASIFDKYDKAENYFHLGTLGNAINSPVEKEKGFGTAYIKEAESIRKSDSDSRIGCAKAEQRVNDMHIRIITSDLKEKNHENEIVNYDPLILFNRMLDVESKYVNKEEMKAKRGLQKIGVLLDLPFPLLNIKNNKIDVDLFNISTYDIKTEQYVASRTTKTTTRTIQGQTYGYSVRDVGNNNYEVKALKGSDRQVSETNTIVDRKRGKVFRGKYNYMPYLDKQSLTKDEAQNLEQCWEKTIKINELLARYGELGFLKMGEKSSISKQIDLLIEEQTKIVENIIIRLGKPLVEQRLEQYQKCVDILLKEANEFKTELKSKNISYKDLKKAIVDAESKRISAYNKLVSSYSKLL